MTIKIMWLHSHVTNASGSSKFLYNVLKELSTKFEITLFVQKAISVYDNFEKLPIKIVVMSDCSTSDLKFWFNFSSETKKQKNILKKTSSNFDLVISSFFPMNFIAQDLKIKHLQFCFQPYAFFWDDELINSLPFFKRNILKYFKRKYSLFDILATKNSDIILTINNGSQNAIKKIYDKNSIPTNMGIDIQKIELPDNSLKLDYSKILLHSTDWSVLKNTIWLIEQFSIIQKSFPDIALMITETKIDSKEKNKAQKLIQRKNIKNVNFLGTLSTTDYVKYLNSADLVIYSGYGSGITTSLFVLECMGLGIPALISEQASEDIIHEKTGFIFKDSTQFHYYLKKLLEDDELRLHLGENAKKYVLEKHSWKNTATIFEKNIFSLINNS